MAHVFSVASQVAKSEATVLITGESGTGKEVLARFIHENSTHSSGPFVAVNCAAIPDNLLESELFGYEKGAFTGANNRKLGKFELAQGGTMLLDELGEIPLHLQPKLLRVLQEREVERLGGEKPQKIDVRIVTTTNKNLKTLVENGSFREDLYYRLNVINIELPPLRERKEDLPDLVGFFVQKYSDINHKPVRTISQNALTARMDYDWPGNVRELEHTIERAVILAKGLELTAQDLFLHGITVKSFLESQKDILTAPANERYEKLEPSVSENATHTIAEMEKELILSTLKKVSGNRTKAAELLGITVRTLRNKLHEYKENGLDAE
jgi:two-component system response regulator FlrC